MRNGVEVTIKNMIVGEVPLDRAVMYQYLVGFAYLIIGLFVYFRRGSAHKARHFYILCLASFIFFCFHYTGKLNTFDKVIYFGNVAAGLLAPTVFLHFCLTFPEPRKWFREPVRGRRCCTCRRCCCSWPIWALPPARVQIAVLADRSALDARPRLDAVRDRALHLSAAGRARAWSTARPKTRSSASS